VKLREITLSDDDVTFYYRLRNDDRTYHWFFSGRKFSLEEVKEWLGDQVDDVIYVAEEAGRPVGSCSVHNVNLNSRTGELGRIMIEPEMRNQGLASKMVALLINECSKTSLVYVYANVKRVNGAMCRVFEKLRLRQVEGDPVFFWKVLREG